MTLQILLALTGFAFVTSVTPGPNNLMLLASGANYGFRRTLPHMAGISGGFAVMVALVGVGLMGLFDAWPPARLVLAVLSVVYMLWLAWKIANAGEPGHSDRKGTKAGARPLTFMEAALFQWVNPKAWAMALTSITLYAPGRELVAVIAVAIVFAAVNLPSVSLWAWLGQEMRRVLTNPTRLRLFNWTMAALLVLSLYPVLSL